jgi:hypothetical protein
MGAKSGRKRTFIYVWLAGATEFTDKLLIPGDAFSRRPDGRRRSTAVLQLLYTEASALEWLFPREKATLRDTGKGT